jgi:pyridoxine 5-phosphate synthase
MPKLGVNIDHVATVREARRTWEPDPVEAARVCAAAGCDSIVCHLREDRRHIKDADLFQIRKTVETRLNLEMSVARDIVDIACEVRPDQATLVPERRQEITTEGGLDVLRSERKVKAVVERLVSCGIETSLFIDPRRGQIDASKRTGAEIIELHTGEYSNARTPSEARRRLKELESAVRYARARGLVVNAGHGLTYKNVKPVASLAGVNELNIGHSIISRAVFVGLGAAVREMLRLVRRIG